MKFEYFIKAVEEHVWKCSVTLHGIREDISATVESLTDNQEEYDLLMDAIPHIYRDTYNKTKVQQTLYSNGGEVYVSDEGTTNTVETPYDAELEGRVGGGILLSVSNTPSGCSFQHPDKYLEMGTLNMKYNVTLGKDGVMITKSGHNHYSDSKTVKKVTGGVVRSIIRDFKKDPTVKGVYKDYKDGNISVDDAGDILNPKLNRHINENMGRYVGLMNKGFSDEEIDIVSEYVPISKVYG